MPGIWIATLWLGLGIFDATQTFVVMRSEGMHHAWVSLFAITVVSWIPWALATPLAIRLGRRFPLPPRNAWDARPWLAHLVLCAAIGLAFAAWTTFLFSLFNPFLDIVPSAFFPAFSNRFLSGMLSFVVLYAGILGIRYGLDSRMRLALSQTEAARLSEGLSKAQFAALRRQIEPHFLFNTLNGVAGLVREGRATAAVEMIVALGDFLRRMLEDSDRQEVPLDDEMKVVCDYLDITKMRFEDRLQLSIDIPRELAFAIVPTLILQPLVENAIKHGIAGRVDGGAIAIGATHRSGILTIRVRNDAPQPTLPQQSGRIGIGLANVRTRLHNLYGDACELRMHNPSAHVVEVSISLPLRGCATLA